MPVLTEMYTLSLHDALPILGGTPTIVERLPRRVLVPRVRFEREEGARLRPLPARTLVVRERRLAHRPSLGERCSSGLRDRKSTRLNSSHLGISYAVFCLKKK